MFRVQQYMRTTVSNNNIDDKGAQARSTQLIFANQLKCKSRLKLRVFVLKVATSALI